MNKDGVAAPVVGTTSLKNLYDLLGTLDDCLLLSAQGNLLFAFDRCDSRQVDSGGDGIFRGTLQVSGSHWALLTLRNFVVVKLLLVSSKDHVMN